MSKIHNKQNNIIIEYLFPLTWIVFIMWKLGKLKRDYDGSYRGDPEKFFIRRWIFEYIPIRGITKRGTKYCGNWHLFRLIFWEIHLLICEKGYIEKKEHIKFP